MVMEEELANEVSESFHAIREICSSLDESEYRKLSLELVRLTSYFIRCSGLSNVRKAYEEIKKQCERASETGDA